MTQMRAMFVRAFLLMLVICLGVGCKSKQASSGVPLTIDPNDAHRIGYTISWSTSLRVGRRMAITQVRLLDGRVIVVEKPNNLVSSVLLKDGTLQWRRLVAAKTDTLAEPFSYEGNVLVNSETELFTIEAETGRLLQSADLREVVHARPEVVGHLAIFGGINGRIFAHDLRSNNPKWQYQMTAGITVPPVEYGHTVFVCDTNGVYASLLTQDGTLMFKGRTFARISARPAVTSLGAFVASEDQTLYALNALSGRDNWKYPAGSALTIGPVVFGNTIFLSIPKQGLVVLDARSSSELWRLDMNVTPVMLTETKLILHDDNSLYVVDPPTGKVVSQVPVLRLQKVLTTESGSLVIVTRDGVIMRLDPTR